MELTKYSNRRHRKMGATAKSSFEFAKLPLELRSEIYGYVKPDKWWHEYTIDPRSGTITKLSTRECSLPPLFQAAKWILLEAVDSLTKGTCAVHVSSSKIGLSFPLEPLLQPDRSPGPIIVDQDTIQIPFCKTIKITVRIPQKVLDDFMQTRRTVTDVVGWLNSCDRKTLPRVEVKLESGSGVKPVLNDFKMLMGPLVRLNKDLESVKIWSDTGYSYDAEVEQHCARLAHLLRGRFDKDTAKTLMFEQAMLDTRLTTADLSKRLTQLQYQHECAVLRAEQERRIGWRQEPHQSRGSSSEPVQVDLRPLPIDKRSLVDVTLGINALRDWCTTYEVNRPRWLRQLGNVFDSEIKEVETRGLK